jgi:hypothetical protein
MNLEKHRFKIAVIAKFWHFLDHSGEHYRFFPGKMKGWEKIIFRIIAEGD